MKQLLFGLIAYVALLCHVSVTRAELFHLYPGDIIQTAVDSSVTGDMILLHAGVYTETVYFDADTISIGPFSEGVWIRNAAFVFGGGSTKQTVVYGLNFDGADGAAITLHNASGVTVEEVHVSGKGGTAGIFAGYGSDLEINDSVIEDCYYSAIEGYSHASGSFGQISITGTTLRNNALSSGMAPLVPEMVDGRQEYRERENYDRDQNRGGTLNFPLGGGSYSLENCLLEGNSTNYLAAVIAAGSQANDGLVYGHLQNCTVALNYAPSAAIYWGVDNSPLEIANCLWLGNGDFGEDAFQGSVTVTGPQVAFPYDHGIPGAVDEDPMCCDAAAGDYRLGYESYCLPENNPSGEQIGAFGAGNCAGVDVESKPEQPSGFQLAAYPNPFNPSTMMSFSLPMASHTTLTVYNLQGNKVATLADGMMPAGYNEVVFDASSLSSGTYIYSLKAGDLFTTGKVMLIK